MELIANWLWQGSVVALATAALLRSLNGLRARARYAVCWAGLFAVLLSPLSSFQMGMPPAPDLEGAAAASDVRLSLPDAWWTSDAIVIVAAALWSAAQGLRLALATAALHRTKRRCRAFPRAQEIRLPHWTRVRERGRRAHLRLSEQVGAAAVLGGRSPLIAVAPALLDRLADDELDRVVIHEWAHVQRRDDVANAVQLAVRVIAGWHPAVWYLDRRLQAEREAACDEVAVTMTGSAKAYGACLVKLAGLPRASVQLLPALEAMSSSTLTGRVERVLSQQRDRSPQWSGGVAATAILLLAGVSFAAGSLDFVDRARIPPASGARPLQLETSVSPAHAERARPHLRASIGSETALRRSSSQAPPRRPLSRDLATSHNMPEPLAGAREAPPATASDSFRPVSADALLATLDRASDPVAALISQGPPLVHGPTETQRPPVPGEPASPWAAAADAGVAVGRGSKKAGLATAGFVTRVGKTIAGSF